MAGRKVSAADIPTPGPWLVRSEAKPGASALRLILGVAPATDNRSGGWPYFVRRNHSLELGSSSLHIATGIQRLADARLIAAAPDLADVLLRLLIAPELGARDLNTRTREAITAGWELLVRVAPHLEIGS